MNEVTKPDFDIWTKNIIEFIRRFPEEAPRVVKEQLVTIYEQGAQRKWIEEWDKQYSVGIPAESTYGRKCQEKY